MGITRRNYPPLAIYGGRPVRAKFLPYGRQMVEEEDIAAVVDVLRSDWLTTGPKVKEFEEAIAARVGARYGVVFSSGTAALHAAAFAARLGPGDEAITTALTFAATANCILYSGAKPVFADVCNDTLNLDPDQVRQFISPQTKAILPVDYAGHPADLDAFREMADDHGLVIIEDAAHALGAIYKNRPVGSLADMTIFSFHPVKHITTGEGGMVVTNNEEFAQRLRIFRNHGIKSDACERSAAGQWYYEMTDLGYNYRLPDINCALGLSQLGRLDKNLSRRRDVAKRYDDAFLKNEAILTPKVRPFVEAAWHLYPVRVVNGLDRNEFFKALRAENLGVNVHYIPVHLHPYYRARFGCQDGTYPVAEKAYSQLISLPMFHTLTDADVNDVIEAVNKVTEGIQRETK